MIVSLWSGRFVVILISRSILVVICGFQAIIGRTCNCCSFVSLTQPEIILIVLYTQLNTVEYLLVICVRFHPVPGRHTLHYWKPEIMPKIHWPPQLVPANLLVIFLFLVSSLFPTPSKCTLNVNVLSNLILRYFGLTSLVKLMFSITRFSILFALLSFCWNTVGVVLLGLRVYVLKYSWTFF